MLNHIAARLAQITGDETGFETPLNNPMQPWVDIPRLHHLLPYESYDPQSKLFFNKSSTGFVLIAMPIVGASLDDQGQMANFFAQEKNLPEGCAMQWLLWSSPRIAPQMRFWGNARQGEIFTKLVQKRQSFLLEKALRGEKEVIRDFVLMISYTIPEHVTGVVEQERLCQTRRELQASLSKIGMITEILEAEGLLQEVGNMLNFRESPEPEKVAWNPHDSLSKQIMNHDASFKVERDLVIKDDRYAIKTWYPKVSPRYWSLAHMDRFLGDILDGDQQVPCSFALHYGIFVEQGQLKEKTKAGTKRESLEKSLQNRLMKWQPQIREQYQEAVEVVEQLQRHQRVITSALSVTVFCEQDRLIDIEQSLNQIWLSCGWEFAPATYEHLGSLLSICPMTWTMLGKPSRLRPWEKNVEGCGQALSVLGKAKKTITREAQNMLPIVGEWKGQLTPGIPLTGRRGQLFFWSPFDGFLLPGKQLPSQASNYNLCISGTSGSGKSFFCNELIMTVLGVGGKAFVLDKGESFKNLCNILGGHHIDFDINTNLSLNPFTHIPEGESFEEGKERSRQLNTFLQVLKTMAVPEHELDALQESFLKKALRQVWDLKKSKGTIGDICEVLLNYKDSRGRDLGEMLSSFYSEYRSFFNRSATINMNHDLVVIETHNLEKHLRAVIVQMMIMRVWQRMVSSDRKVPFLILIDEAWELIQGKSSGNFIAAVARTARKYRASLALATQNLDDYFKPESPGATEAFANSEWKCIFNQGSDTTTSMQNHPVLVEFVRNEFREQLLRSLPKAERFSEMLIFGKSVQGIIGRLFCDPFSALLYSTNPQDYLQVQSYTKDGLSVGEAIEAVLQKRASVQ
jgi:conjugal transfer ATP-binding protein TraC